jgi:hypothetical protein
MASMFDLSQENYLMPSGRGQSGSGEEAPARGQVGRTQGSEISGEEDGGRTGRRGAGSGKWTLKENMRYLVFLEEFAELFRDSQTRKKHQVFAIMARHVRTRRTSQCKSHHQKIFKLCGSVPAVIAHLRRQFAPLTLEWQYFKETEPRVLIKRYEAAAEERHGYRILEFNDTLRIEIDSSIIKSY